MKEIKIFRWRNPSSDQFDDTLISILNTFAIKLLPDENGKKQILNQLTPGNAYYFFKLLQEHYDIMIADKYLAIDKKGWRFKSI